MAKNMGITERWLWLPVRRDAAIEKLHLFADGNKIGEIDIRLAQKQPDYYAAADLAAWMGQKLEIAVGGADGSAEQEAGAEMERRLSGVFLSAKKPQTVYPFRPKLHFAPPFGWHNDPNGLVYADGIWHVYYQWNPYGTEWGNMHWGHAVSRDLLHWEHLEPVLFPDETGTVFSGCAFQDKENAAGLGAGTILYYYTAAGGTNEWSKQAGNRFTQRLAYSTDGGRTLQRLEPFCLPCIADGNRDPKVFRHKESGAYIMVLYLEENEFAIFRSDNLLDWKETSRLQIPGMWECPDLFCLSAENEPDMSKWVFWSADGYYVIGSFDGWKFTPETERQMAYASRLPYAAQTFSGTDGRVISLAWLRMANDWGNYRGLMALPAELSLQRDGEDLKISFRPAKEWEEAIRKGGPAESGEQGENAVRLFESPADTSECKGKDGQEQPDCRNTRTDDAVLQRTVSKRIPLGGHPAAVQIVMDAIHGGEAPKGAVGGAWDKTGEIRLELGDKELIFDAAGGQLLILDSRTHQYAAAAAFRKEEEQEFTVIIDQEIAEVFGAHGTIWAAAELEENILETELKVRMSGTDRVAVKSVTV